MESEEHGIWSSLGLLTLRVGVGTLILFGHGWKKLMNFSELSRVFPDPLGIGSDWSLALAVFAEVFCALAIIFGAMTRLAAIPLIATMLVAGLLVHSDAAWAKTELSIIYLIPFLTLAFTGPGKFSVDALYGPLWRGRARN
jgi:putative oxidoreductase